MDQREANQVADFIWAAVEKQVRAAIAAEIAACEYLEERIPARSPRDKILGIHWMPYIEGEGWLEFLNTLIESDGEYDEDIVPGYAPWW